MACKFKFQFVQKATEDLDGIVFYLNHQLGNSKAARRFLADLNTVIQEACAFPESGSPLDNELFPNKTVRKKLIGSYILYYLPDVDAQIIYILRIIYGRRNLDEILREMKLS